MQGMERAKAIRDLLSMATAKAPSVSDRIALKDAAGAVARGESPELVKTDERWQDRAQERIEATGAMFEPNSIGGGKVTFEFNKPIKAVVRLDVPIDMRWKSDAQIHIGGDIVRLEDFWRWDEPPEVIKRKLELVLAELYRNGVDVDAQKAAVDLALTAQDTESLAGVLRGLAPQCRAMTTHNKINKIPRKWSGNATYTQYALHEAERQLAVIDALQLVAKEKGWNYKGLIKNTKERLKTRIAELTDAVDKEEEGLRQSLWAKNAQSDREKSTPIENTAVTYTDSPTAKKIAEYRSKLTGHLTLDNLSEVADIAMDEATNAASDVKDACDKLAEGSKRAQERHEEIKRLKRQIKKTHGDEARDLVRQCNRLVDEANDWMFVESQKLREACAERMKTFVSSIRPLTSRTDEDVAYEVFSAANSKAKLVSLAVRGLKAYPADMVEAVLSKKLQLSAATRASYNEEYRRIELSAKGDISGPIHEFGHALERRCPIIRALETDFFNKRTAGQRSEPLSKLIGTGYGSNEFAIADHFIDPYMGKLYPNAFELVSMGFEMFYTEPWNLAKDEEYFKFILGIILTVTP